MVHKLLRPRPVLSVKGC